MNIKREIEFELTDAQAEDIYKSGLWPSAYLHDEIDIYFNALRKPGDYKVVGIRVGGTSSGTLSEGGGG